MNVSRRPFAAEAATGLLTARAAAQSPKTSEPANTTTA